MENKHTPSLYDGLGEALYILAELQLLIKRLGKDVK